MGAAHPWKNLLSLENSPENLTGAKAGVSVQPDSKGTLSGEGQGSQTYCVPARATWHFLQ